MLKPLITTLSMTVIISTPLYADEPNTWNIGLSTHVTESPFVGGDTDISVRGIRIDNDPFHLSGITKAISQDKQKQIYIGAGLDDWDRKRGDGEAVKDLEDLDWAVNARLGAAWKLGQKNIVSLDLAQDINAHKGQHAKLRYTYVPNKKFNGYAELQHLSSKMADYYVGVDTNEVTATRPAYQADAAHALKLGLRTQQAISQKLTFVGELNTTHFDNNITDSPLIEKKTIWGVGLGLAYRWK